MNGRLAGESRIVCKNCGRRVSDAVIAYGKTHAARFGGALYCVNRQKQIGKARTERN